MAAIVWPLRCASWVAAMFLATLGSAATAHGADEKSPGPAAPGGRETVLRPAVGRSAPNILFILADDLGWRDITPFGSTVHETPNLERLARRGMRFTQAYSANPLCSPTRASILTGLYPARIGITVPGCHLPQEVLEASLPARAALT